MARVEGVSTVEMGIAQAAEMIRRGGVVAFPTETVYGLGADAFNPLAVARIFELKGRPRFDPLIVHIADEAQMDRLAATVPGAALQLSRRFWPGPLTIVVPKRPEVPDLVTAGLTTVAIRMPDHPIAIQFIRECGRPIAAPSANKFGEVSPTRAEHVTGQFGTAVEIVLDGGPCRVGLESTIVSFAGPRPMLLRPGGVSREEIEAILGPLEVPDEKTSAPLSPGRLSRHYATRTPLVLDPTVEGNHRRGLLTLRAPPVGLGFGVVEILSRSGDLREAAAHLFAAMRRLDILELELIVAHPVPEEGLGSAINDRLRRAAHP